MDPPPTRAGGRWVRLVAFKPIRADLDAGLGTSHRRRPTSLLGDDCSACVWQCYKTTKHSSRTSRSVGSVRGQVESASGQTVEMEGCGFAPLYPSSNAARQPYPDTDSGAAEPGGRTSTEKQSKRVGSVEKTVRQRLFVLETRLSLLSQSHTSMPWHYAVSGWDHV